MMFQTEFMVELNEFAVKNRLSNEHLALMFDVSVPSMARWRTGQTSPHEVVKKLVRLRIEQWDRNEDL